MIIHFDGIHPEVSPKNAMTRQLELRNLMAGDTEHSLNPMAKSTTEVRAVARRFGVNFFGGFEAWVDGKTMEYL